MRRCSPSLLPRSAVKAEAKALIKKFFSRVQHCRSEADWQSLRAQSHRKTPEDEKWREVGRRATAESKPSPELFLCVSAWSDSSSVLRLPSPQMPDERVQGWFAARVSFCSLFLFAQVQLLL